MHNKGKSIVKVINVGLSRVSRPSQNLTLTLNEPKKLTLTLPNSNSIPDSKPKPKIYYLPKNPEPYTQLGPIS